MTRDIGIAEELLRMRLWRLERWPVEGIPDCLRVADDRGKRCAITRWVSCLMLELTHERRESRTAAAAG